MIGMPLINSFSFTSARGLQCLGVDAKKFTVPIKHIHILYSRVSLNCVVLFVILKKKM